MRGNPGRGNGGQGLPTGRGKPQLFAEIENGITDSSSLVGMDNNSDFENEGVMRRVSRTGVQLMDIMLSVFVLTTVTPVHNYREENNLGRGAIFLTAGLLLAGAGSMIYRSSRSMNSIWIGLRTLFHTIGIILSVLFIQDAYSFSTNPTGPRDPIPQYAFYPIIFFIFALLLSFISVRRIDSSVARGYAVQENEDDVVFREDTGKKMN